MSTISMAPAPSFTATRLRLTARGRRVVAALLAAPVVALLALAIMHNAPAAIASSDAVEASQTASFETVTVLPGDTLWSIAGEVAPHADRRDVISAISRLNVLGGTAIFVGQELAIPAEYAPSAE